MAKILLIGSGGREHAIAHSLAQSELVQSIIVSPGNAGTESVNKSSNRKIDLKDVVEICKKEGFNLVVVGPEDPLASGLADDLNKVGIPVFGPCKDAAEIEASKSWSKDFMVRQGIPTAQHKSFKSSEAAKSFITQVDWPGYVVKASGLAAGKGVIVTMTKKDALEAVDTIYNNFKSASDTIIVEEMLVGEEMSVLCFSDGTHISVMPPAQDHKRLEEGDNGPNTGGMGAYCPCTCANREQLNNIQKNVLQRAVDGLKAEGRPFIGVLYAGLMLTKEGPKVLEFNCRFGDPETQVILPLLKTDLFAIMKACVEHRLDKINVEFEDNTHAVGVCLVSGGYPGSYVKGKTISNFENITNAIVYDAGTAIGPGRTKVTSGGRVLAVVAKNINFNEAANIALKYCESIQFEGKFYRKDIGWRELARKQTITNNGITYKGAGVDIHSGNQFIQNIKDLVKSTSIKGVIGNIGGFGGLFDLESTKNYKNPILVTGTDGVGTKLLVAQECGIHDTIGEDLVAMCVNDILMHGAKPLFFLDYLATGHLNVGEAQQILKGVVTGCKKSKCALSGGETAEMPGLYTAGHYDLAGFTVGIVEKEKMLPKTQDMAEGDILLALPSSGFHSNGYSLVRKIIKEAGFSYSDSSPFENNKTIGEELLTPTEIYIQDLLEVLESGLVLGAAHITGGGLEENIPRILPDNLSAQIDVHSWAIPNIFYWMAAYGVSSSEMLKTFNLGIGVVLIVKKENIDQVKKLIPRKDVYTLGKLIKREKDISKVITNGLEDLFKNEILKLIRNHPTCYIHRPKKRIAVLISGSGTNLQALIDHSKNTISAADIKLVISNIPDVYGIERAKKAQIPTAVVSHKKYKTRMEFEDAMHAKLTEASIDIICLAGFMRILTPKFVNAWRGKMLNIHPSLLPAFKGMDAQKQALNSGAKITGCSVHFVSEEVDCGGIITQEAVDIKTRNLDELVETIKSAEHKAYPRAMELLAREEVKLNDDGSVWFKE